MPKLVHKWANWVKNIEALFEKYDEMITWTHRPLSKIPHPGLRI